jgi:hypothetical protein
MDASTSLERDVVWRFEPPTSEQLARFRARIIADLSRGKEIPPARPFAIVSPAGMRQAADLERAFCVRGARVVEKRLHPRWPRCASAVIGQGLERDSLLRAYLHEQLWTALFPRAHAELWILENDRALERALAWETALRELAPGVRVTVQGLLESLDAELTAFHLPIERNLEREWRAWCGAQAA